MRHPLHPLMLLMALILASTTARAQAADTPSATGALSAPPLVEAAPSASTVQPPPSPQVADTEQGRFTPKRPEGAFLLEGLAGGVGSVVGIFAAAVVSMNVVGSQMRCSYFFSSSSECTMLFITSLGAGLSLGSSAGVAIAGHLLGGDGQYLAALGGAAVAFALGVGLAIPGFLSPQLGGALVISLPMIGAVVGYELSVGHGGAAPAQPLASRGRARLVPSAAILPGGGMALLAGVF